MKPGLIIKKEAGRTGQISIVRKTHMYVKRLDATWTFRMTRIEQGVELVIKHIKLL